MEPIICERLVACTTARPQLWEVLTDTDTLNRLAGMKPLRVRPLSNETAARFTAETRLAGFPVAWEEAPYEWTYLEAFSVRRKMLRGPVTGLHLQYLLADGADGAAGGTTVTLRLTLTPRHAALRPMIWASGTRSLYELSRGVLRLDARVHAGKVAAHARPTVDERRLREAVLRLSDTEKLPLVQRLETLVRDGEDAMVRRLRPFALADAWGLPQRDILRLCLYAARDGLLEAHWELVCPSCRGPSQRIASPKDVPEHGACQLCDLRFPAAAEEALELTFAPHPALRVVPEATFCMGGPARTPHVVAQSVLPHGITRDLRAPRRAGRYRLFLRGGTSSPVFVTADGSPVVSISSADIGVLTLPEVEAGGVIQVQHQGAEETHVKLEMVDFALQAVNLRHLGGLPDGLRETVGA